MIDETNLSAGHAASVLMLGMGVPPPSATPRVQVRHHAPCSCENRPRNEEACQQALPSRRCRAGVAERLVLSRARFSAGTAELALVVPELADVDPDAVGAELADMDLEAVDAELATAAVALRSRRSRSSRMYCMKSCSMRFLMTTSNIAQDRMTWLKTIPAKSTGMQFPKLMTCW
jgi:hypothetical protein